MKNEYESNLVLLTHYSILGILAISAEIILIGSFVFFSVILLRKYFNFLADKLSQSAQNKPGRVTAPPSVYYLLLLFLSYRSLPACQSVARALQGHPGVLAPPGSGFGSVQGLTTLGWIVINGIRFFIDLSAGARSGPSREEIGSNFLILLILCIEEQTFLGTTNFQNKLANQKQRGIYMVGAHHEHQHQHQE